MTDTTDAQKLIADTLARHRLEQALRIGKGDHLEWWECLGCDWVSERFDLNDPDIERVKRAHLAEAIDEALGGLTREWAAADAKCHGATVERTVSGTPDAADRWLAVDEPGWVKVSRWVSGWSEAQ